MSSVLTGLSDSLSSVIVSSFRLTTTTEPRRARSWRRRLQLVLGVPTAVASDPVLLVVIRRLLEPAVANGVVLNP